MTDLATPAGTAHLLRVHGIRPQKRFGQHFLVSRTTLTKILDAAELTSQDNVLEVGAGIGTLTAALAACAGSVLAVEMDRALLPALAETVAPFSNVRVQTGDVMRLDLAALVARLPTPRKAVSNLPYSIASALTVRLLESPWGFVRLVFTVQREVAERLAAAPGGKDYGALSIAVQYRAGVRLVARVPAGAFLPRPDVESAVIVLVPHAAPPVDVGEETMFFRVVRAAFAQRRKTLRNTLASGLALAPAVVEDACRAAGVDPGRRAETLDLAGFAAVTRVLRGLRR